IQAILMVLIIVAVGYFVGYKGWANKGVTNFITKLIVNITLPCTIVMAFLNNLTIEKMADSWIYIAAAFVAVGIVYLIGKLVALKINPKRRGVFTALFSFSNSVFIGLPIATAIFGPDGLIFAVFYFIANSTFMNSAGYLEIAKDGQVIAGKEKQKTNAKELLKRVFSPPLIAIIVSFVLVLLKVQLPSFLNMALTYTGGITSPLALIFIGIILQRNGLKKMRKIEKGISISLIGRFILSPIVMLLVAMLFRLDTFSTQVFIIQMSLPAMVQTAIFAETFGADTEFASKGVIVTMLLSFITIPIYVALFGLM
ncbi:MAG: AEC family transporter, partial [Christensenellaceae bacterium]